jgi:hypothetical protein
MNVNCSVHSSRRFERVCWICDDKIQDMDAEVQVDPSVKDLADGGENRKAIPSLSHCKSGRDTLSG